MALPTTPAGLAVTRRGSPDPVVSGWNCVGGRRRTAANNGGGLQIVADSVEMLFDSVGKFKNEVKQTWTAADSGGD